MKIERWRCRQALFGLRRQPLSGWTTESSDRELQISWDRGSHRLRGEVRTGAQLRAGSVGLVWWQGALRDEEVKVAI